MTTRVKGTLGYLAPEYAMWGKVSESCDVYSFGILLLEIVTGRKPIERLSGGVKRTITEWADPLIAADQIHDLVDPRLRGEFDGPQLRRILYAAARCVQSEPERRPTMRQVVSILRGAAAAADPVKNSKLLVAGDSPADGGGDASSAVISVSPGMLRIQSVKYEEELMAMDDAGSEDEDERDFSRSGSDGASSYGVFGAIEVKRVRATGYGGQQQPQQQLQALNRRGALRS